MRLHVEKHVHKLKFTPGIPLRVIILSQEEDLVQTSLLDVETEDDGSCNSNALPEWMWASNVAIYSNQMKLQEHHVFVLPKQQLPSTRNSHEGGVPDRRAAGGVKLLLDVTSYPDRVNITVSLVLHCGQAAHVYKLLEGLEVVHAMTLIVRIYLRANEMNMKNDENSEVVISQGEYFASYVLPSQSTCTKESCTKESCEEYCKSNEPPNTKLVCVKCEGNTCYCCSETKSWDLFIFNDTYESESSDDEDVNDEGSQSRYKVTSDNDVERVSESSYSGDDLKYPPGFKPSMINMEEVNKKEKCATSNEVNDHVNSTLKKLEEPVSKGKLTSNDSACSKRVHMRGLGHKAKKGRGILCVWEPTLFVKDNVISSDSFLALMASLIDLPLDCYTYIRAHKMAIKMNKLDRFLISKGLLASFPFLLALFLDRYLSDHHHVLMRELSIYYVPAPFRLFHSQFNLDDFEKNGSSNEEILSNRSLLLKELNNANSIDSLKAAQKSSLGYRRLSLEQQADLKRNVSNDKIKGLIKTSNQLLFPTAKFLTVHLFLMNFFRDVLNMFGFGHKWCGWINGCLNSAMRLVLVNGSPTSEFQFHKASLFLGIPIDSTSTFSHLFFADDDIFVGKSDSMNISTILNVLKCFHLAPGLNINFHKSKLMGIDTRPEEVDVSAKTIGCLIFTTLFVHLGDKVGAIYDEDGALNSSSSLSKRSLWLDIIREMAKKIDHASMVDTFRHPPKGCTEEEQLTFFIPHSWSLTLRNISNHWVWSIEDTHEFSVIFVRQLLDDSILPNEEVTTRVDNADIWRARNKYPGVIVNESFIFVTHSLFLVRVSKGMEKRLGDKGEGCCELGGGGGGGGVVVGVGVVCGKGVDSRDEGEVQWERCLDYLLKRGQGKCTRERQMVGYEGQVCAVERDVIVDRGRGEDIKHDTSVECFYYKTQGHMTTMCELQRHQGSQDVDAKVNGYFETIWIKINGAFNDIGYDKNISKVEGTIWIRDLYITRVGDRRFHLHENVTRFHREHKTYAPSHPSNANVRNSQGSFVSNLKLDKTNNVMSHQETEACDPFIFNDTYESESSNDEDVNDEGSQSRYKVTSDNDVERVSESSCMHNNDLLYDNNHNITMHDKDKVLSKDPFKLYDILNKRR
uniref:RNA-directed DNA polymerase, eukaryota n=1 Tax=Tanacetum cinerariifolium TaxID=118510 RepID=A0A699GTQ9_TANCI|nr:RNA-directed DNA polymerase, eukaryota [Tanacetum cinerariifolium]